MDYTMKTIELISRAGSGPVMGKLFTQRASERPDVTAVTDQFKSLTFSALNRRVNQLAHALIARGLQVGDRLALLSENRSEYIEVQLACAKIGVIAACQNWRQSKAELSHSIQLVTPRMVICSERHRQSLEQLQLSFEHTLQLGVDYEGTLAAHSPDDPSVGVHPEDGVLILYTSGTTGYPKGALISHRAMIARGALMFADWGLTEEDCFLAWSPQFHLAGTDLSLCSLMQGAAVHIVDGFDPVRIVDLLEKHFINWFVMVPGMMEQTIAEVRRRNIKPKGIKVVGAMADLVSPQLIAEVTTIMNAPYLNSFGATETGLAPASKGVIPVGVTPEHFDKLQSSFCEVRLVDDDDNEVPVGEVGEMSLRSATLFSGYWGAEQTNQHDFRNGWFHMGDLFRRQPDGTLSYVDRKKYMIKSGGENIYPAEIERVLMSSGQIEEAAVVRKPDPKWGEVPAAFVVRADPSVDEDTVIALCRGAIAGYKVPKRVYFIDASDMPRSETGKIKRHDLEKMLPLE